VTTLFEVVDVKSLVSKQALIFLFAVPHERYSQNKYNTNRQKCKALI